jgi:jasmonate ZIM domain-containing protein
LQHKAGQGIRRYVKQQAAAETMEARSVALPLMPGADLTQEEERLQPAAQMTIFYGGGRVLVLDDVPADKAAGLLQLITAVVPLGPGAKTEVARKASLQWFMEKRKNRAAARAAPYLRPL